MIDLTTCACEASCFVHGHGQIVKYVWILPFYRVLAWFGRDDDVMVDHVANLGGESEKALVGAVGISAAGCVAELMTTHY